MMPQFTVILEEYCSFMGARHILKAEKLAIVDRADKITIFSKVAIVYFQALGFCIFAD